MIIASKQQLCRTGFLNLGTTGILGTTILCCRNRSVRHNRIPASAHWALRCYASSTFPITITKNVLPNVPVGAGRAKPFVIRHILLLLLTDMKLKVQSFNKLPKILGLLSGEQGFKLPSSWPNSTCSSLQLAVLEVQAPLPSACSAHTLTDPC